jgi:DNA-binding CsgD family transcriptional regulator
VREQQLLAQVVTGVDTREIAHRMLLSEHTVQDHLKSVFAKTAAHSRRSLLARVLGT